MLPNVPHSFTQEQVGIAAMLTFAANRGQLWRDIKTGDVGIDGQLEFVDPNGGATGKTVAVQVKCGPSYFREETADGWKFYPSPKHRTYWERYPLPVLLILHDPIGKVSYWIDARQELRKSDMDAQAFLEVPKKNVLETTELSLLFENAGAQAETFIAKVEDIIPALILRHSQNESFPISYFDLFAQGLTNICRSLYFGIDLAMTAAKANLVINVSDSKLSIEPKDHEFLFNYVRFLVAQHLADINFSDCLIDWVDREMQPAFTAPLTVRGRQLIVAINEREEELIRQGRLTDSKGLHIAQEGFFEMVTESYITRLPVIHQFQKILRETINSPPAATSANYL